MRNFMLLLVLALAACSPDNGDPDNDCRGTYTATGMAYRDEIAGYQVVSGDVTLLGVTDPTQLVCLRRIQGNLTIMGTGGAKGLPNLVSVSGSVTVVDAEEDPATELGGFPALQTIGEALILKELPRLKDIAGLDALVTVGSIEIRANPELLFISGLDGLDQVSGTIAVSDNAKLQRIDGLQARAIRALALYRNPALSSVVGLEGLEELAAGLIVADTQLTSLDFLAKAKAPAGEPIAMNVSLTENPRLLSIEGLASFANVERLELRDNFALESLHGLEGLTQVGFVSIDRNHGLTSLAGLENVRSVAGLSVSRNFRLTNLEALLGTTSYGGSSVSITDNANLQECRANDLVEHLHSITSATSWVPSVYGNAACAMP